MSITKYIVNNLSGQTISEINSTTIITDTISANTYSNLPIPTSISSGPTAPGTAVVANETDVDINFSDGIGTAWSFSSTGLTFPDDTIQTTAYTGGTGSGVTILNNVNNRIITATGNVGELNAESLITFDGAKLSLLFQSGDEGGEILLGKAATNTSLSGDGITIDVYQNRLRIFEQGGNARGGYFDLTTLGNSVSTNLVPTLYLLEATTEDITYNLPGSFTEDPCRYSIVSNSVNVSSSWFNTSNYTFTPQKVGYWEITASYDVYRNTEASMSIKKNNVIVAAAGSFNSVAQTITKIVYLNGSTDFINIVNVGGASNSRSQFASRSWFQARWVGE
jgi:hypothetical protein